MVLHDRCINRFFFGLLFIALYTLEPFSIQRPASIINMALVPTTVPIFGTIRTRLSEIAHTFSVTSLITPVLTIGPEIQKNELLLERCRHELQRK